MNLIETKHTQIGLFFGSFNPIHIGHLIIANHIINETELQEIWFVVSPQSPAKQPKNLISPEHRIEMVNIATKENPLILPTDIELSLPRPSYTIDTLNKFSSIYPDKQFKLLLGSDNMYGFQKWKNYQAILQQYSIYIYPRLGYYNHAFRNHKQVTVINAPILQLSSTTIRHNISQQKSIDYLVYPAVQKYIEENKFYT